MYEVKGKMYFVRVFVIFAIFLSVSSNKIPKETDVFELSVVHLNDFHARFEQTNLNAGTCKTDGECIGGFSRLYKQVMTILEDKPKSILLNAGDNFQGTLWYSVGKWNVTQQFMNTLPFDAEVLGNHEFDDGIAGIVPYIKAIRHPIIVSNIDDSLEPDIQGTYTKSVVVERDGKKIGIVGVLTSTTEQISSSGKLKFLDESASVNAEAERLVKEKGVFTVIVLSHCGYDVDQVMALNASEKISLIVGGHSHTFLYTGDKPPGPDPVGGPYPTIVKSKYGHDILVTQASAYSKYLGNITIYLDNNGEIVDYSGAPIYLDTTFPQDEGINKLLEPWKQLVDNQGNVIIGSTLVTLSAEHCYTQECTLGNFVTDAFVYQYTKSAPEGWWTEAAIGIINAGGLRNTIEVGNISYSDMVTACPFSNTVDFGQLQGKCLKELMESTVQEYQYGSVYSSLSLLQVSDITYRDMVTSYPFGNTVDFGQLQGKYLKGLMESTIKEYQYESTVSSLTLLQVSGLKVVYDLTKPKGQQVVSLQARCANCTVPQYSDGVPEEIYNISSTFIFGKWWRRI